jgi:peptidoglycan/LPS O-acetylase OafA/YrhL
MNKKLFPLEIEEHDYLLALRGLAVIGVLLGHAFGIGSKSLGVYISQSSTSVFAMIDHPLDLWRGTLFVITPLLGTNFVLLFFVQSGYLMGKVFHEGRYPFRLDGIANFYKARFLRIAPLLYLNLIVCLLFFRFGPVSLSEFLGDFFFVTNFTGRSINLVTWSLSHEVQYYLMCPLVFLIFRAASWKTLACCVLATAAIYYFTRSGSGLWYHFAYVYAFVAGYAVNLVIKLFPITITERLKIATLLIGIVLLNCGYNYLWLLEHRNAAELLVLLLSVAMVFIMELRSGYEVTAAHSLISKVVRAAIVTGSLTYGIYLWHYVIIRKVSGPFSNLIEKTLERIDMPFSWFSIPLFHLVQISSVAAVVPCCLL